MYDFMSSKTSSLGGNSITQTIAGLYQDDDYYLYGGYSNYIEDSTETSSIDIDWSAGDNHYGYFQVFTNSDHCTIQKQRDEREFGPDKSTSFDGDQEELEWRWFTETKQIKQPPISHNMGDLDDDDYFKLLNDQEDIDSNGFLINYQDWQREGEDDDGEDYIQWMTEVDGDLWFDKFDHSNSEQYESIRSSGVVSINILGLTGLINSVFSLWVAFTWLGDFTENTDFWYSWFGPMFVNGLLWIPLTLVWPASTFGSLTMVRMIKLMAQLTLTGPFIAYLANIGAMYYTFYMEPVASESTFATTDEANQYWYGYIGLSLFNSVVSLLTVPKVIAYKDERVKQEQLSESKEEISTAQDEDNDDNTTTGDDGIVRF